MKVLLQPGSGVAGQRANLNEGEAHHLRVRRAREHEAVELLDGAGLVGTGLLVRVGSEWMVEVQTAERHAIEFPLTLAVAAGDRERFFWMAEKAVELGVTAIIPLETARSLTVATRFRKSGTGKLRRLVLEATKQCGAPWAPTVEAPVPLVDFATRPVAGEGWLADPSGSAPPERLDRSPLTVVVGPEGGFTEEERATLIGAGYRPVALGPHTLRFETAAVAAVAVALTARMRGTDG